MPARAQTHGQCLLSLCSAASQGPGGRPPPIIIANLRSHLGNKTRRSWQANVLPGNACAPKWSAR